MTSYHVDLFPLLIDKLKIIYQTESKLNTKIKVIDLEAGKYFVQSRMFNQDGHRTTLVIAIELLDKQHKL